MIQQNRVRSWCLFLAAAALAVMASGGLAAAQRKAAAATPAAGSSSGKTLGEKTAPITMEVFSDFQCPACRELYQNTLRQVFETYVQAGKVYFIHRDYPLPMHKHSRDAARIANAAARIGKFEPVCEALYGRQDVWGADGSVEAVVASVLTPGEMKRVRELLKTGNLDAAIEKDISLGQSYRVTQTPSVFITNRGQMTPLAPGGVNYRFLKEYLDHLLRQ